MKKLLSLLLLMAIPVMAQLPVGTRVQPVTIATNNGVISWGSNSVTIATFTNTLVTSNAVIISSSGLLTNAGASVLGPVTMTGDFGLFSTNVGISSITNSDFSVANVSTIMITNGSVGEYVFTGFAGGRDGQILTIITIPTGTNATFMNLNASSAVANRINNMGYGTTNTTGAGSFSFIYSSYLSNWVLRSFVP